MAILDIAASVMYTNSLKALLHRLPGEDFASPYLQVEQPPSQKSKKAT